MEKVVETNKAALLAEESQHATLSTRKTAIEAKKRDVEDGIMRGLSGDLSPVAQGSPAADPRMNGRASITPVTPADPDRPDIEELTPPPEEPAPDVDPHVSAANGTRGLTPQPQQHHQQGPSTRQLPAAVQAPPPPPPQAGADLLSSLNIPPVRQYSGSPGGGVAKKRKLDDEAAVFGSGEDAMADLDDDVAELLRQESAGR